MEIERTKKDKTLKKVTIIGNILLWISLLPSLGVAFVSGFMGDAPGDRYTKFQQLSIHIVMAICLLNPMVILISAIISLVLIMKRHFIPSLWIELLPLILFLIAIMLLIGFSLQP